MELLKHHHHCEEETQTKSRLPIRDGIKNYLRILSAKGGGVTRYVKEHFKPYLIQKKLFLVLSACFNFFGFRPQLGGETFWTKMTKKKPLIAVN